MQTDHAPGGRRLLLCERDGLVVERLRNLASWEDIEVCSVESMALFATLASRLEFDAYAVGATHARALTGARIDPAWTPLWLLVPLGERGEAAQFLLARPDAVLLDRALRDPEAVRNAWRSSAGGEAETPAAAEERDPVRLTFAPFGLSERQLEVLGRALTGESSREIASGLFISEPTVRNHLHAIYERVGVSGRRELFGRFVRGLIAANA